MSISISRHIPAIGKGPALGLKSAFAVLLCLGLAACQMQGGYNGTTTRLVERDVEAPEILDRKEVVIWDGTASNAGVWASSAQAKAPQRVVLRHLTNGRFVIGTLFPATAKEARISADAAQALEIAANNAQEVQITALRRDGEAKTPAPAQVILDSNIALTTEEAAPVATPIIAAPAAGDRIQIGHFSVQENARNALRKLEAIGVSGQTQESQLRGKPSWTVTASGDKTVLNKVKAAGFADAYSLK